MKGLAGDMRERGVYLGFVSSSRALSKSHIEMAKASAFPVPESTLKKRKTAKAVRDLKIYQGEHWRH